MHVNNLSGPRMTPLTSADRAPSTPNPRFGSLLQGTSAAAQTGAPSGGTVVSTAVQGAPGSAVGAPYTQSLPADAKPEQVAMIEELAKLSFVSLVAGTFSMGQSGGIQLESVD